MVQTSPLTYEKIYYTLWETARRYSSFTQFRVIGRSHDDRMIPMLELGTGSDAVFCIAGLRGVDQWVPSCLVHMAQEYCKAYECGWMIEEIYEVKKLLDEVRLCLIPIGNPDGYEICSRGFSAVRNPVYRQMLKMTGTSPGEFPYNARGIDLCRNFPTSYYSRKRIHQEPASENETKALIRVFQEYQSLGLLSFQQLEKRIVYFRQPQAFAYNQRSCRIARQLQKHTRYRLEKASGTEQNRKKDRQSVDGAAEQFYAEITKQPALLIETPDSGGENPAKEDDRDRDYRELHTLLLEYIFSLQE